MATRGLCGERVATGQAPTERCLRKASADIAHDLEFLQLAWRKRSSRLGWTMWFVTARVLWDFLFEPKRNEVDKKRHRFADDVLAADYLLPGTWAKTAAELKKSAPPEAARMRKAANKLAAHLTYSRADLRHGGGIAPSADVHRFLVGVAVVWLAALPPARRVWFGGGFA
jgi:hypothetical protein